MSIERLFIMTATAAILPNSIRADLERAVQILKSVGCSAIFLFGSAAEGNFKNTSDIDLAVRGCPPRAFFPVFGQLILELEHPVDLIDLDDHSLFGQHLQRNSKLVQIG